MKIAVLKENELGELCVVSNTDTVSRSVKQGFEVWLESGVGIGAGNEDVVKETVVAEIIDGFALLWTKANILLKINPLGKYNGWSEIDTLKLGAILITNQLLTITNINSNNKLSSFFINF